MSEIKESGGNAITSNFSVFDIGGWSFFDLLEVLQAVRQPVIDAQEPIFSNQTRQKFFSHFSVPRVYNRENSSNIFLPISIFLTVYFNKT